MKGNSRLKAANAKDGEIIKVLTEADWVVDNFK